MSSQSPLPFKRSNSSEAVFKSALAHSTRMSAWSGRTFDGSRIIRTFFQENHTANTCPVCDK